MDPFWIAIVFAASLVAMLLIGLLVLLLRGGGKTIAQARAVHGRIVLDVPSAQKRMLWVRYRLTLIVPPARGQRTNPGSCYGILLRLKVNGQPLEVARGGLAPAGFEHFGLIDYMYSFTGGPGQQTLATTVKVKQLLGTEPLHIVGSIETARENELLEADMWVTGQ